MTKVIKIIGLISFFVLNNFLNSKVVFASNSSPYWEIQSIDTMKLSRDLAREELNNAQFDKVISKVVENISKVGATHVAVGTPYDEEFLPYLRRWVKAARSEGLDVWFRSNFSGWEGWFGYSPISRDQHLQKTKEFILRNPDLFEDGDIFTSCTECENGGPGDPRDTKDIRGFRQFLVDEHGVTKEAFKTIGKDVKSNLFSMNLDVARLVMDRETTQKLGGIVVVDHYVGKPGELVQDIGEISNLSGGKIVLGEMGVPIPGIHGNLTAVQQAEWIGEALRNLSKEASLVGLNYWVATNGSTSIWYEDGSEKPSVDVIESFFRPKRVDGKVVDELGRPVKNARIFADTKISYTDTKGFFEISLNPSSEKIIIRAQGYKDEEISTSGLRDSIDVILEKESESVVYKFLKAIYSKIKAIDIQRFGI